MTLANCGHPRPLLLRDGRLEELGCVGPMAGAFDDGAWGCTEIALQAGDTLVLYTDGVLDTVGAAGDRFGDGSGCARRSGGAEHAEPEALVAALADALEAFRQGPQRDDTAIVAVRFTGVPAHAYEAAAAGTWVACRARAASTAPDPGSPACGAAAASPTSTRTARA